MVWTRSAHLKCLVVLERERASEAGRKGGGREREDTERGLAGTEKKGYKNRERDSETDRQTERVCV